MPRRSTTVLVCSALALSPVAVLSAHAAMADDSPVPTPGGSLTTAAPTAATGGSASATADPSSSQSANASTTASPSATASAPVTASPSISGSNSRAVQFANTSFFTQPIDQAPLAANSDAQAAELAKQVRDHFGGVAAFNVWDWNVGFSKATANTPKTDVQYVDCQNKGYMPPDITTGDAYFKQVPIPASATPAVGGDGHLSVYDQGADKLWEFWQAKKVNGQWQACWGGRIDNVSQNIGQFKEGYSSNAVNTAMAGSMISVEDVQRGEINHAIGLAIPNPASYDKVSWPALRSDGLAGSTSPILEGTRLRLDPTLDLDQYNLTPIGRMIAESAQKYGFFIDNKAGAVSVSTEAGDAQEAETGTNPWKGLLGSTPSWQVLQNFPWDKTQFLPKDYGKSGAGATSTASATATASPSATASSSAPASGSASVAPTGTPTGTASASPVASATATAEPTTTPAPAPSATPAPADTVAPTATATDAPSVPAVTAPTGDGYRSGGGQPRHHHHDH